MKSNFTPKINKNCKNLELIATGTTQGYFAFDFRDCNINAVNLSTYMNYFTNTENMLLRYRNRVKNNAVILITVEYPIFLCNESVNSQHQGAKKAYNNFIKLNKYNSKINHLRLWEMDERAHDLIIDGWNRASGFDSHFIDGMEISSDEKLKIDYSVRRLISLINFCKDNGWQPVILALPISRELNRIIHINAKKQYFYEPIDRVVSSTGCKVWDYIEDKYFCARNNYMGIWFLNDRGRQRFTDEIIERIHRED